MMMNPLYRRAAVLALAFPWLAAGALLAHCASDAYLDKTVQCINAAPTRAAADACRAAIKVDGGAVQEASVPHG
jgi:hypothetical protein